MPNLLMRLLGPATLLLALLSSGCDRTFHVIEDVRAPDGRHRAVVFTTEGMGPGSDLHTSVSVLRSGRSRLRWPPNAFTALHYEEDSPSGAFFGPRITVRWLGPTELEISYDPRASTLRRHEAVDGVRVVYRVAEQEDAPSRGLPKRERNR
jgi:hypothetical protein